MTWGHLKAQSDVLLAQRAVERFGAARLWQAVDTCPNLPRLLKWARALVLARQVSKEGIRALVKVHCLLDWVGISERGAKHDDVVVPDAVPELERTNIRWKVKQP